MLPFGETVLLWRRQRRLTQEGLARRAGISRPNLSAIERGKREVGLKTLRALAMALGVQPGILVEGMGPWANQPPLSREAMERVADAVAYGRRLHRQEEKRLAGLMGVLLRSKLAAWKREPRPRGAGKRTASSAWLSLAASYPPEVVDSLLQRIAERTR